MSNKKSKLKGNVKGYIHFENLKNNAEELININDDIKDAFKRIKKIKKNITKDDIWKGKSSEKFDTKFQVIKDKYNDRIPPVENYKELINNVVIEKYIKAEELNIKYITDISDKDL